MRREVVQRLSLLKDEQLEEVGTKLDVSVATSKKGKQGALLNSILRYLTSEAVEDLEDEGLSVFLKLNDEIAEMLKEKPNIKDVKVEENGTVDSEEKDKEEADTETEDERVVGGKQPKMSFHKLREFKITGGVVASGDKSLDYASLCYQMQEAKEIGYSAREVRSAVIKAMKAGSSLRKYFESEGASLTEKEFRAMLRSYHEVEDSAELLTQMANSYQGDKAGGDKEKEKDFVLRMLDMKKKIITMSKDEGCPLNEMKVRERFLHALGVGFKVDTVRLAVERVLNRKQLKDEELLREVCQVVARDAENRKKTKLRKGADINSLDMVTDDDVELRNTPKHEILAEMKKMERKMEERKGPDDAILAALKKMDVRMNEMSATRNDELAALKFELKEVKQELATCRNERGGNGGGDRGGARGGAGGGRGGFRGGYRGNTRDRQGNRYIKCAPCEEGNLFCTHCSICGSGDHRRRDCTENQ